MKKIIRGLLLGSTGFVALGAVLVGSVGFLAYQREHQHDLKALFFLSQFPLQQANASALSLDDLLIALDLPPVVSTQTVKPQATEDNDESDFWLEIFNYVQAQTRRGQGPLTPLPEDIQQYLAAHHDTLAAVEKQLLSEPQPRWGINLVTLSDFEVRQPMFIGVVNLHRLLLLRSFVASSQGDQVQANRSLLAAWSLTQAMARRPDSTSQLASTIQANNQLAFLRHLPTVAADWQKRITDEDYASMMLRSIQFDGWITYKGLQNAYTFSAQDRLSPALVASLPQSYVRLSAVDMSERLNTYFHSLENQNLCEFEPSDVAASASWWNQLALVGLPRSTRQWQRAGETMLAVELTGLVLQAKQLAAQKGRWPEALPNLASKVCAGSQWQYQVYADNSMSIVFQGTTTWRNSYDFGSSLRYNAPAWESNLL